MMQRVSARERLVAAAPSAFVLDKDMGAPMMTDAARFAVTNADGRPVVPLTAAQKYHFDTKGWLAVPGVLDIAEIEEMRDFVLRLKADPESIPEHQRSPVGGPLQRLTDHPVVIGFAQEFIYNPFTDGGGDSLENDHGYGFRQEHSFITVRRSAGGRRGAQGDGSFGPHNGNGMMRLPGDCHYYQAFPGRAYAGMTRIVWELNEVGEDDGGTLLLSGSHKAAYPAPEEIFNADSSLWETYACPAGSVLMFTEALTHSGQPWRNPDRERVAVFNCYNSIHNKWHNWDPPAAVLEDMPPKRRSLYRPVYVAGNWVREQAQPAQG